MKKQDILKYGEKLAKVEDRGYDYGFKDAVNLLWPAIEALDRIEREGHKHDRAWVVDQAWPVLHDLEKALEGGR